MAGKYVVFDGMPWSGVSTQTKLLENEMRSSVVFIREAGKTPFGQRSTALADFLSLWAAREVAQHYRVAPALKEGKSVFSDRGGASTFAFLLHGEGHQEFESMYRDLQKMVYNTAHGRRKPHLYVIFDLPAEESRARALKIGSKARELSYYERVRHGFKKFRDKNENIVVIDAMGTPEEIHKKVMHVLRAKGVLG